MNLFYRIALKSLALLGALLAVLALGAALLIAEPQWFLTAGTVTRAARVFGRAYHPRWKTMAFEIRSLNLREKQVRIRAQDFCFENAAAGLEGCVKTLDVRFNLSLYFFGARLTKIYSLAVAGDHFTLDQTVKSPNAPVKKSGGLPTRLPALPAHIERAVVELGARRH